MSPMCEKCWSDAHSEIGDVARRYHELIEERRERPCTPEQQAGPDSAMCQRCKRKTIHQHCGICVICGQTNSGEAKR